MRLEGDRSSVVAPGHWSYFTPRTLPALLARSGFRVLSIETVVSELDRILLHPPTRDCNIGSQRCGPPHRLARSGPRGRMSHALAISWLVYSPWFRTPDRLALTIG